MAKVSDYIVKQCAKKNMGDLLIIYSGCAISIIQDSKHLWNIQEIEPIRVQGVSGDHNINMAADLHFSAVDNTGTFRTVVINNILSDENSPVNLVSGNQLRESGFAALIYPAPCPCCVVLNPFSTEPINFQLKIKNKIFSLYTLNYQDPTVSPCPASNASLITRARSFLAGNMLLEELMHLRMSHEYTGKLVEQSKRVNGDAKATSNNYQPATETWADDPDRWNLNMFDMGEEFTTIHGNCYATMIVIMKSLYLHKNSESITVKSILQQAFSRAGIRPYILCSDGAGEYGDEGLKHGLVSALEHAIRRLSITTHA
eukprot:1290219-Rhodomonas_salina.2